MLDPGGAGRAALQAAGLHQEPGHDRRRRPGHHPRPGAAAALHAHAALQLPAALAVRGRPTPCSSGTIHSGGAAPRQPRPDPDLRAGVPRGRCAGSGRSSPAPLALIAGHRSRSIFKLGSEFMPPLDEGSLLYMPTTMPGHLHRPRRRSCCRSRTGSSSSSPRWSACSARPGGPRPPPTRRRSPCWRRSIIAQAASPSGGKADTWYSSWAPEWLKAVFRHITPGPHLPGGADRPR
ncbi:MAG: hypothetical protein M0C28_01520 [Candidatus Moduliflexus flocculans]|nr:hypothetical protein [Candidatus Moduliflexus flocculans]